MVFPQLFFLKAVNDHIQFSGVFYIFFMLYKSSIFNNWILCYSLGTRQEIGMNVPSVLWHACMCGNHFVNLSESGHEHFPNRRQAKRSREETSMPNLLSRQGQKQNFSGKCGNVGVGSVYVLPSGPQFQQKQKQLIYHIVHLMM